MTYSLEMINGRNGDLMQLEILDTHGRMTKDIIKGAVLDLFLNAGLGFRHMVTYVYDYDVRLERIRKPVIRLEMIRSSDLGAEFPDSDMFSQLIINGRPARLMDTRKFIGKLVYV